MRCNKALHDYSVSEDTKTKRKCAEALVSTCIASLKDISDTRQKDDKRIGDVEAMLLSYKRYVSPRRLARRLISALKNAVKLLDIPQAVGALRFLEMWLRMRIDVRFLHHLIDLMPTLARLSPIKEPAVRFELNKVKLALIWSHSLHHRTTVAIPLSPSGSNMGSTRLWGHSSDVIAEALTQVEYEQFCLIPAVDFNDKSWANPGRVSRLRAFIERSNATSDWVASNILVQASPVLQLKVFCKFIWIAQRCHHLGNHSSCAAIFAGCSKNCVSRLYRVWPTPDKQYRLLFSLVQGITSHEKNYARYRAVLQGQLANPEAPFIPHVAVLLRDLTFVEDGNNDLAPDGLPNWDKIRMLHSVLSIIHRARTTPYKKLRSAPSQLMALVERLPRKDEVFLDKRSFDMRPRAGGDASSSTVELYSEVSTSSADNDAGDTLSISSADEALAEVESDAELFKS